jgi:putative transposase
MHLTLKNETTRPAGANLLQQQAKFDAFVEEFNCERPHEDAEPAMHMALLAVIGV